MASLIVLAGVTAHSAYKKRKENKANHSDMNNSSMTTEAVVIAQRSSSEVPPPYVVPPAYTAECKPPAHLFLPPSTDTLAAASDTPLVVLDPTAANAECAAHGHDVQRYYAIYPYAAFMPRTRPCHRCGEECPARMCLFTCNKNKDKRTKRAAVVAREKQ